MLGWVICLAIFAGLEALFILASLVTIVVAGRRNHNQQVDLNVAARKIEGLTSITQTQASALDVAKAELAKLKANPPSLHNIVVGYTDDQIAQLACLIAAQMKETVH